MLFLKNSVISMFAFVFEELTLKETCLPYFAKVFRQEIFWHDGKSFELTHFLKKFL